MQAAMDRFVSVQRAMDIAGVRSRATLWKWGRAGTFPKARKVGPRKIGFLESELRDWLEQRRIAVS